jgi:hypothetical protein
MAFHRGPKISTNGLVLSLDIANPKSYTSGSTTWRDTSGYFFTGSITNSPSYSANNGGSLVFNGTNNYVSVPYDATLAPTSQITFGSWAYLDSWAISTSIRILSKTESGGYQLGMNDGLYANRLGALVFLSGSYRTVSVPTSSLSPGWHHFAVTCNGQNTILYVDGIAQSTLSLPASGSIQYATNNHLLVGAEPGAGTVVAGNYWPGRIANAFIYNRGLSAVEVSQMYNATKGKFNV